VKERDERNLIQIVYILEKKRKRINIRIMIWLHSKKQLMAAIKKKNFCVIFFEKNSRSHPPNIP